MCNNLIDNWYAIFVVTGLEDQIKIKLDKLFQGSLRFVVPKRRLKERKLGIWNEILKTLYPGYILIQGKMDLENCHDIKRVSGVIRILADRDGPLNINNEEIYILQKLVGVDGIIEYSDALIQGSKIIVTDGPLVSMEGLIHSIDRRKGRARVKVRLFGEERLVDFGLNILIPSE